MHTRPCAEARPTLWYLASRAPPPLLLHAPAEGGGKSLALKMSSVSFDDGAGVVTSSGRERMAAKLAAAGAAVDAEEEAYTARLAPFLSAAGAPAPPPSELLFEGGQDASASMGRLRVKRGQGSKMSSTELLATNWSFLRAEDLATFPTVPGVRKRRGKRAVGDTRGNESPRRSSDLRELEHRLEVELGLSLSREASAASILSSGGALDDGPGSPRESGTGIILPPIRLSRQASLLGGVPEHEASFDGMPDSATEGGAVAQTPTQTLQQQGDSLSSASTPAGSSARRRSSVRSKRSGMELERKLSLLRRRASELPKSLMELEIAKADEEAATIEQASREHGTDAGLPPTLSSRPSIVPAGLDEAVKAMEEVLGVPEESEKKDSATGDEGETSLGGGGDDNDWAKATNRPNSPVIMWRNSTRVKLATDVPEELLTMLADYSGAAGDSANEFSIAGSGSVTTRAVTIAAMRRCADNKKARAERAKFMNLRIDSMHTPPVQVSWGAADDNMGGNDGHVHEDGSERTAAAQGLPPRRRPPRFGAWYLPPAKWQGEHRAGESDETNGGSEGLDPAATFDTRIPTISGLYSSTLYREYVRKLGHKLPHYLQERRDQRERVRRK